MMGKEANRLLKLKYDMYSKPTRFIKGKGPAKILSEENFQALGINLLTRGDGENINLEQQQEIEMSA